MTTMKPFRRRLRLAVAAWLVFQVVSLSALVPRDCCAAHHPVRADREERCHERADSPYCPMRSQGRNCPMHPPGDGVAAGTTADSHAGHGDGHHQAVEPAPSAAAHASHAAVPESSPTEQCAVGGTCSAPMTALAVILSNHGIVPAATLAPANADRALAPGTLDEHLISRLAAPDSPPPRA